MPDLGLSLYVPEICYKQKSLYPGEISNRIISFESLWICSNSFWQYMQNLLQRSEEKL